MNYQRSAKKIHFSFHYLMQSKKIDTRLFKRVKIPYNHSKRASFVYVEKEFLKKCKEHPSINHKGRPPHNKAIKENDIIIENTDSIEALENTQDFQIDFFHYLEDIPLDSSIDINIISNS